MLHLRQALRLLREELAALIRVGGQIVELPFHIASFHILNAVQLPVAVQPGGMAREAVGRHLLFDLGGVHADALGIIRFATGLLGGEPYGAIRDGAIAARAMRQVLIDRARLRATQKRGGTWKRVPLDDESLGVEEQADRLLALDEALGRLAEIDPRLSRIVECRFFGGMTDRETAVVLSISERTVRRDWLKARLWLYAELVEGESVGSAAPEP